AMRPARMKAEICSNTWSDLRPPLSGRKEARGGRSGRADRALRCEGPALGMACLCSSPRAGSRARRDAEIDLLHLRIVLELLGRAFQHGATGLQHIGMVGDVEGERDRLLRQQQGQALLVQAMQRVIERLDDSRREPEA